MKYPENLEPVTQERLLLPNGEWAVVPKAKPEFLVWTGAPVEDNYNKTVLEYKGAPTFAELVILRAFWNSGWDGFWIDRFGHGFRRSFQTQSDNPPLKFRAADLPPKPDSVTNEVWDLVKSGHGAWDVFCWNNVSCVFAEAKHASEDELKPNQVSFLQDALQTGLREHSFLLVEWTLANPRTPAR